MKKVNFIALLTGLVLLLGVSAGCGSKAAESPAASNASASKPAGDKPLKIAFILKTLSNEYWAGVNTALEKIAKEKGIEATIFSVQDESDAQGQLKKFEDALLQKFDVICFSPISPANLNSAIVEANKAGIPVLNIDDLADVDDLKKNGGYIDAFVSADNIVMGKMGAEEIVKALGDAGGEVAIIEGIPGVTGSEDRKKGAKEVFASNPNIKVVAEQPADWDKVKALDVATNIIQSHPNLKAIHAANDTMALGALEAVRNAGKAGQILVAGVDGVPEAISAIEKGDMIATARQGTYETALAATEGAIELAKNGGSKGGEMKSIFVKLVKVTKENAKDFK